MNNTYIVLINLICVYNALSVILPVCYIRYAPARKGDVRVEWKENERTGKLEKAYYYVSDEGSVRIPQFARQRAFTYNTLVAAREKGQYAHPSQILERLNGINRECNFAYVKSIFLDIYRWFAFRKEEFLSHNLFHRIRHVVTKKHFFFGRVYSRCLRRLFKFSNCYKNEENLSLLNFYASWDQNRLDMSKRCLKHAVESSLSSTPEPWLFERILALYEHTDSIEVLNSIFRRLNTEKYDFCNDGRHNNIKLFNSAAARGLYRWFCGTDRTFPIQQIHELSRLKFNDTDRLTVIKRDVAENDDEYTLRMNRSLSNAVEHIYKLMQKLEELPQSEGRYDEMGIGYETVQLNREELVAIHILCKLKLCRVQRNMEMLIEGLFQMVQFLKEKVEECSKKGERPAFISQFKRSVCIPYMSLLMSTVAHDYTSLIRMKTIQEELERDGIPTSYKLYLSKDALKGFMVFGMQKFCSLFDFSEQLHNSETDICGIITNQNQTYLYSHRDRSIVASTDVKTMDLWNAGIRDYLTGPLKCQLVITMRSVRMKDSIRDIIKKAKETLLAGTGMPLQFDRVVNLHLRRCVDIDPIEEFRPDLLEGGGSDVLITHPIHKFIYMVLDE